MKRQPESSLIQASPGDGTFAGARRLYLEQALRMSLIQRLRAVEDMAAAAQLIQTAARRPPTTK